MVLQIAKIGRINYDKALKLQERLLKLRQQKAIADTMLLLEHDPVITLGSNTVQGNILVSEDSLRRQGIEIQKINRGGDATFHGPGQIVGYPIMDLASQGKDLHLYINNIEEVFIKLLKNEYGILAGRDPKHRGVWVGTEKITAIGCSVKKWVSMHGFAFNINIDLNCFKLIVPCGIRDKGVTSLQKLVGRTLNMDVVSEQVIKHFTSIFGVEIFQISKNDLEEMMGDDCVESQIPGMVENTP